MVDKTIPAFPLEIVYTQENEKFNGMSLRDYFAAKAMQAVFPKNWDMFMDETFETPEEVVSGTANDAYELADAMLKARAL